MITDQEFLCSTTEFAALHNRDVNEVHDSLEPALRWLQEEGDALARILEPACVAVCAMRDGDRESFIRVVWECEDFPEIEAELRIFTDRQELHIDEKYMTDWTGSLQELLQSFEAARGTA